MTPQEWLAIAVAVVMLSAPAATARRLGALTGLGRLGGRGALDGVGVRDGKGRAISRGGMRRQRPAVLAGLLMVGGIVGPYLVGGLPLAVAGTAVSGATWFAARDAARRRNVAARRAQLLAALRVLIGELEAGGRPAPTLAAAAGVAPAHARVFDAAAAAADSGDAGSVLSGEPATRVIGLAWRLSEQAGAELSGVLSRVVHDLTAADEQRRAVAVALAGPRASAVVLAGLPLLGMALGAAMGARPWAFLVGEAAGRVVCCAGVLLDVGGLLWMRRILHRAERP